MTLQNISQAQTEVIAAWRCIPETERTLELLSEVATQVILGLCVEPEQKELDSVEH